MKKAEHTFSAAAAAKDLPLSARWGGDSVTCIDVQVTCSVECCLLERSAKHAEGFQHEAKLIVAIEPRSVLFFAVAAAVAM